MQGKSKSGRILKCGQDVPGRGNEQHDGHAGPGIETLPCGGRKKLPSDQKVENGRAQREDQGDQAFEQQTNAETCSQSVCPCSGMRFLFIEHPQKGPHGKRDGEGQHDVGYQDARKEKQADAGGHDQAGIEASQLTKGPSAERGCQPREPDGGKRDRNTRGPVIGAENFVRDSHQPIDQR